MILLSVRKRKTSLALRKIFYRRALEERKTPKEEKKNTREKKNKRNEESATALENALQYVKCQRFCHSRGVEDDLERAPSNERSIDFTVDGNAVEAGALGRRCLGNLRTKKNSQIKLQVLVTMQNYSFCKNGFASAIASTSLSSKKSQINNTHVSFFFLQRNCIYQYTYWRHTHKYLQNFPRSVS